MLKSLYQSVKFLIAHLVLEFVICGMYCSSKMVNSAFVFSLNWRRLLNNNDKQRSFVGLSSKSLLFWDQSSSLMLPCSSCLKIKSCAHTQVNIRFINPPLGLRFYKSDITLVTCCNINIIYIYNIYILGYRIGRIFKIDYQNITMTRLIKNTN